MAEEETKNIEVEIPVPPPETPPQETVAPEAAKTVEEEKAVVATPIEEPPNDSQPTPACDEKETEASADEPTEEKAFGGSVGRDAQLARVATEKRMSLIKAWEESEKCKAENKAHKKIASIEAWENSKKATIEAELKKIEEALEKKKAEYAEKMMNKIAMIHKEAEEKKAMVEAKKGEDLLKVEEVAAKCRATGKPPKKLLGFF